jgi:predicted HicB family RNase H-like nuclease
MTTTFDPHAYTITIRRVTEDGKRLFHGSVRELPDLATYERTHKRAYELLIEAIESLHKEAEAAGRPFPAPAEVQDEFSGRVTLRLPISLHRSVARLAEGEGASLNTYIITALAERVGESTHGTTTTLPLATQLASQGVHQLASGRTLFRIGSIASATSDKPVDVSFTNYTTTVRHGAATKPRKRMRDLDFLVYYYGPGSTEMTTRDYSPSSFPSTEVSEEQPHTFGGVAPAAPKLRRTERG